MDLALNNLQRLICHKTHQTKLNYQFLIPLLIPILTHSENLIFLNFGSVFLYINLCGLFNSKAIHPSNLGLQNMPTAFLQRVKTPG